MKVVENILFSQFEMTMQICELKNFQVSKKIVHSYYFSQFIFQKNFAQNILLTPMLWDTSVQSVQSSLTNQSYGT